jgi:hypothetical protein
LYDGDDFSSNQGSASLEAPPIVVRQHEIELTTLDAFLGLDHGVGHPNSLWARQKHLST